MIYKKSREAIEIRYSDGDVSKWLKTNTGSRSHRCNYAVVDLDIEYEDFIVILCPIMIHSTKDTILFIKYEDL